MNARHSSFRFHAVRLAIGATALVAWSSAAMAASSAPASDPKARYEQERTMCNVGLSVQDRSTCLREAGAAYAEASRRRLDRGQTAQQYEQNALMRCNALPVEDRKDCEARVHGKGTSSGSVDGGGIYKETVTRQPAQ